MPATDKDRQVLVRGDSSQAQEQVCAAFAQVISALRLQNLDAHAASQEGAAPETRIAGESELPGDMVALQPESQGLETTPSLNALCIDESMTIDDGAVRPRLHDASVAWSPCPSSFDQPGDSSDDQQRRVWLDMMVERLSNEGVLQLETTHQGWQLDLDVPIGGAAAHLMLALQRDGGELKITARPVGEHDPAALAHHLQDLHDWLARQGVRHRFFIQT